MKAFAELCIVTVSVLTGVGYATANLKDLFPGHQMPSWLLTLTCVEKLPVYFSTMAVLSQVIGDPFFSLFIIVFGMLMFIPLLSSYRSTKVHSLEELKHVRRNFGWKTYGLAIACLVPLGGWVWNFEVKLAPRQPLQMLPELLELGGMQLRECREDKWECWRLLLFFADKRLLLFVASYLANRLITSVFATDMLLHIWTESINWDSEEMHKRADYIDYRNAVKANSRLFEKFYENKQMSSSAPSPKSRQADFLGVLTFGFAGG